MGTPPYGMLAEGAVHVELALPLPPLPEREGILNAPGEPSDDCRHLGDLVGREREERFLGQRSRRRRSAWPCPRRASSRSTC